MIQTILTQIAPPLHVLIIDARDELAGAAVIYSVAVRLSSRQRGDMSLLCTMGAHPWDANHCPRCGKDNPHPKQPRIAMIGDQVWMAEDLTVVHFRNGDPIPEATSSADLREAGKKGLPAWHRTLSRGGHVRLYNWFALGDERGLAPSGWRVPSVEDFEVLFRAVDRQDLVRSDQGGSNASGFSGQVSSAYWTATRRWFNPPTAFSFTLPASGDAIMKTTEDQCEGCLVRCVREGEAAPEKPGRRASGASEHGSSSRRERKLETK